MQSEGASYMQSEGASYMQSEGASYMQSEGASYMQSEGAFTHSNVPFMLFLCSCFIHKFDSTNTYSNTFQHA
jgi:hypothetical protein